LGRPFTAEYALSNHSIDRKLPQDIRPSDLTGEQSQQMRRSNRGEIPSELVAKPSISGADGAASISRHSALSIKDWRRAFQNQRGWFEREMTTEVTGCRIADGAESLIKIEGDQKMEYKDITAPGPYC
jgi:hypothetical protein